MSSRKASGIYFASVVIAQSDVLGPCYRALFQRSLLVGNLSSRKASGNQTLGEIQKYAVFLYFAKKVFWGGVRGTSFIP
ncbi:MAG: hypothetical protein A2Y14_03100 [Verrucomicrobia bacterium GWF2_51_19]|nr:MAG: hypothetical protein A2Y14_03100 [Verrucomicrobia bacterium GWF2_51_19]